jgi:hypothetical protein
MKRSPVLQTLHQKVDFCQQGASGSGKPTQTAGRSSQPGAAEKSTVDKDSPVVKNLTINVTSQDASSSGILPQGADNCKTFECED